MDKNKICLHQWIKPDNKTNIKVEGRGNCNTCIPHKDNKNCRCYCEITAPQELEIKEKEDAVY